MPDRETNVSQVKQLLDESEHTKPDVIVIDGLYRADMIEFALKYKNEGGFIICDNAEGFGFQEGFVDKGLQRVDFFGNTPGVALPHATSIYLEPCFLFDAKHPIAVVAKE